MYWHDLRKLAALTPDTEHDLPVFERAGRHRRTALAVARIRAIALIVIDADPLPAPSAWLIRDLRNVGTIGADA